MQTKEMTKMKEQRLLNEDSYNSISRKTGIHWNMVKRAEKEPENVPAGILRRIAKYFGYKTSELFKID